MTLISLDILYCHYVRQIILANGNYSNTKRDKKNQRNDSGTKNAVKLIDPIKPQTNTRGSRETWRHACMRLTVWFGFITDKPKNIVAEVLKGC